MRIQNAINGAQALLVNHGEEKIRAVLLDASRSLRTWSSLKKEVPNVQAHVQESLLEEIRTAYASTVRAAVRREGEWSQLSYSYQIGFGAKRLAFLALGKAVEGFTEHCRILAANPDYADAADLLSQAERVLTSNFEDLLRKVQLMGQSVFKDALKADPSFWQACMDEWGKGPGYKSRVEARNRQWFDAEARLKLEVELRALIAREWTRTLDSMTDLLETEA